MNVPVYALVEIAITHDHFRAAVALEVLRRHAGHEHRDGVVELADKLLHVRVVLAGHGGPASWPAAALRSAAREPRAWRGLLLVAAIATIDASMARATTVHTMRFILSPFGVWFLGSNRREDAGR
jgi:hypothetical protein